MAPLAANHGFKHVKNGLFARERSGWLEAFFLQQTRYGDGSFCLNMGICVPSLGRWWNNPSDALAGLTIGFRLSEKGPDEGDCWLPAGNRQELADSLVRFASWFPLTDPWYARLATPRDIAEVYRSRTSLVEPGRNPWMMQLSAANYGFLLAEAGEPAAALTWLREAERLMSLEVYTAPGFPDVIHEKVKGARLLKPTSDDTRQLEAVRAAIKELSGQTGSQGIRVETVL